MLQLDRKAHLVLTLDKSPRSANPFIPPPHMRGSLAYITGQVISPNPTGILSIEKSVHSEHSLYGYSWEDLGHAVDNGGWFFHGQGLEAYLSCGELIFTGCISPAHEGKAYVEAHKGNCGRAQCPVCHEGWLIDTTKKTEHRITEAEKILVKWGWRRHKPIHVTVNPEPSLWEQYLDVAKFNKLRRKAQAIAKKAGFSGGSIIYHPERSRCGDCGGKLVGKAFDKHCKACGSKNIVWYFSPHWHLFGFGWITGTKAISEVTGYVVKNHGIRSSIGATIYYQLSHCGIREGKQTLVWFGILHYSKLKIDPYVPEPVGSMVCPICGDKLRLVRYEGTTPPPIAEGGDIVTSTGWIYRYEEVN